MCYLFLFLQNLLTPRLHESSWLPKGLVQICFISTQDFSQLKQNISCCAFSWKRAVSNARGYHLNTSAWVHQVLWSYLVLCKSCLHDFRVPCMGQVYWFPLLLPAENLICMGIGPVYQELSLPSEGWCTRSCWKWWKWWDLLVVLPGIWWSHQGNNPGKGCVWPVPSPFYHSRSPGQGNVWRLCFSVA